MNDMPRYSIIEEKNPREICLLRGCGCQWRRCAFCDYYLDFSRNQEENYQLNRHVLSQVDGRYGQLEIINSGSFCDLDHKTLEKIRHICVEKNIKTLYFECHWMHRHEIAGLRRFYGEEGIQVKIKMGIETFDYHFREEVLHKGIDTNSPEEIAQYADEICLLFGLRGQTTHAMRRDIALGLQYFQRVCVNIMVKNSSKIKPSPVVITDFMSDVYPEYKENPRVDILLNKTDFGVGA